MFCSNCGADVGEGTKFCPNCGAMLSQAAQPVSGPNYEAPAYTAYRAPNPVADYVNVEREHALDEMQRAYEWFAPQQPLYDEYDRINATLPGMNRVGKRALMVWGCIIAGIGLLVTAIGIAEAEAALVTGILFLLGGGGMITGFFLSEASRKRRVSSMNARLDEVGRQLTEHYIAFGKCAFGAEYSNPRVLATILNLIQSGRADTIKEGINLMIADLRHDKMAELSRITAENAQIIARNSAAAARGATAAAVFSAASFFLK